MQHVEAHAREHGREPAAEVVDLIAAAREGEFDRLLALLDPDVVLTADPAAAQIGVASALHGAAAVGEFARYARGATPALLDGAAAVVWLVAGEPRVVYRFTTAGDAITAIELIADPGRLRDLDLVITR